MYVQLLKGRTPADAFRAIAKGKTGIGFIFETQREKLTIQPLAVIFKKGRVKLLVQRRSYNGRIQYIEFSVRRVDFWNLFDGTYIKDGKRHYEQIGKYPLAVERIFAFTELPLNFFDDPLPPDSFMTVSQLSNWIVLEIT